MTHQLEQYRLNVPTKLHRDVEGRKHKITFAAGGLIFAHNKVLLDRSTESDLWSVPGGVVRFDESIEQTVTREIKEELNLNVEVLDSPPFMYHFEVVTPKAIELVILAHFLVKVKAPANILMGGDIIDHKWFSIGSHFRDVYPNVKPAVDFYLNI